MSSSFLSLPGPGRGIPLCAQVTGGLCLERKLGYGPARLLHSRSKGPIQAPQARARLHEALAKLHLSLASLGLPVECLLPTECHPLQAVDVPDLRGKRQPQRAGQKW